MEKGTEGEKGSVVTVTSKQSSNCSEITIKEFLDFLRTAYQVNRGLKNRFLFILANLAAR